MTGTVPLHRQEMLELGALEAYGLLDEYESALFNRAFHNAPATVQQEVIKLQEQLAADVTILAKEEPPESLRERVLAAVNEAIEQETPGPIASIGRRSAAGFSGSADDSRSAGRVQLTYAGQFWRAASFFLAAAAIVLAYTISVTVQQHHELTRQFLDNNTGAQIEELIGPTFKDFFWEVGSTVTPVVFSTDNLDQSSRAVLLVSEEQGVAFLVTERMPELETDQLLTLRVQDAQGRVHTVAQFESKDRLSGLRVDLTGVAMGPNMNWEIASPAGTIMRA